MVNYQVGNWTLYHEELGTSPYIVECSDWVFYCTLSGNKQYSIGSLHFYAMFFHYIVHGKLPWFTSHSDLAKNYHRISQQVVPYSHNLGFSLHHPTFPAL